MLYFCVAFEKNFRIIEKFESVENMKSDDNPDLEDGELEDGELEDQEEDASATPPAVPEIPDSSASTPSSTIKGTELIVIMILVEHNIFQMIAKKPVSLIVMPLEGEKL